MTGDSGDDGYEGSSTESEYYEDAEYEDLGYWSSDEENAEVKAQVQEVAEAAMSAFDMASRPEQAPSTLSDGALVIDSQPQNPIAFVKMKRPRSFDDDDSYESGECSEDDEAAAKITAASILNSFQDPKNSVREPPTVVERDCRTTFCDQCCGFVTVEIARPTAFQRSNRLCHCCKISIGTINRGVVYKNSEHAQLRFCAPCFKKNGPKFIKKVRMMDLSPFVKCSGCHQIKFMEFFHKRQQVYRPWEEQPGQTHYCLTCLPSGFEPDEDKIVPLKIKCIKCDLEKERVAYIRSLQDHFVGTDAVKYLQLWVNDKFCICDDCIVKALSDAMRLTCYRCNRLLPRSKFPLNQQRCAERDDENPGGSNLKLVFSCSECKSQYWDGFSHKFSPLAFKRKRQVSSHQDENTLPLQFKSRRD